MVGMWVVLFRLSPKLVQLTWDCPQWVNAVLWALRMEFTYLIMKT